ncbi:hypothetical protein [Algoriphagus pacificus]|uniref:Uncharacterized protein n=1 Tax=Algoriphagus pacificus TaxID=2811234 RepID=A0ABS3CAX3_9BACT|nr:hypothetical protein [Algoriphagus pacificus]MBN7814257.1 hypothetical protein [Algoriphagus pacificus]
MKPNNTHTNKWLQGFVRVCSWFTFVIGSLTALAGIVIYFLEERNIYMIFSMLFFFSMGLTGWFARRYGLKDFGVNRISKLNAILSLIFGILLVIVLPIIFSNMSGIDDSFLAIRNLIILFTPMLVSSIAILTSRIRTKNRKLMEVTDNKKADNTV